VKLLSSVTVMRLRKPQAKQFIASIGLAGEWVQTSYNSNPVEGQDRGKYAGIGDVWNGSQFVSPEVSEVVE
jgi:hypothetical protein